MRFHLILSLAGLALSALPADGRPRPRIVFAPAPVATCPGCGPRCPGGYCQTAAACYGPACGRVAPAPVSVPRPMPGAPVQGVVLPARPAAPAVVAVPAVPVPGPAAKASGCVGGRCPLKGFDPDGPLGLR